MSAETETKPLKFWVCPCCTFSFTTVDTYAAHLRLMLAKVEAAIALVSK